VQICDSTEFTVRNAQMAMNRRDFFSQLGGRPQPIRPPGGLQANLLRGNCDGCGKCVDACPENIIRLSAGNLPEITFANGQCTFCNDCNAACDRGALVTNGEAEWPWRAKILPNCLEASAIVCRACETSCEENAIRFRPALGGKTIVSIHLERCTGCGACIAGCHAGAIAMFEMESHFTTKEAAA